MQSSKIILGIVCAISALLLIWKNANAQKIEVPEDRCIETKCKWDGISYAYLIEKGYSGDIITKVSYDEILLTTGI